MLAPLLVSLGACGPVEYINQVGNKAASAVSAAKLASAQRYAPYEYTAAEEYLHKAREEAGHAEYQDAIEYGRKARIWRTARGPSPWSEWRRRALPPPTSPRLRTRSRAR